VKIEKINKKIMKSYSSQSDFFAGAIIEITNFCNFRCIHCYNDTKKHMLETYDLDLISDRLEKLGVIYLTLTGGEAMSHPNFKKIYIHLKEKGFIITVFSNLSIVDKYIDLFCEYPPFMISASIYGLSNKDYLNFTRQENQFEVIERNIEALIFHGIELKLKVIVTVNNYQDIFDGKYELFAQKHKCSIFYDSNIFSTKTGNSVPISLRVSPYQAAVLQKKYGFLKSETINTLSPKKYFCENGNSYIYIDINGNISVCMKDFRNQVSIFSEISQIKSFISYRVSEIEDLSKKLFCSSCEKNLGCGWCPIEFEYDGESCIESSFLCQVRHERMKLGD